MKINDFRARCAIIQRSMNGTYEYIEGYHSAINDKTTLKDVENVLGMIPGIEKMVKNSLTKTKQLLRDYVKGVDDDPIATDSDPEAEMEQVNRLCDLLDAINKKNRVALQGVKDTYVTMRKLMLEAAKG